ncbi:hypothetical protein DDI_2750 [Dickeya dianthicola RNS04.9]|nr:hypothetical protein DDI_2750 [Dickeya dianthicola RNS04.9]
MLYSQIASSANCFTRELFHPRAALPAGIGVLYAGHAFSRLFASLNGILTCSYPVTISNTAPLL